MQHQVVPAHKGDVNKKEYYVRRDDGSYLLHFGNYYSFSPEEITTSFQEFGKVLSVDTRGQVRGLCFVRVATEEDAIRCLDGFKTSKSIRILKHKKKEAQNPGKIKPQPNAKVEPLDFKLPHNSNAQGSTNFKANVEKKKSEPKVKPPQSVTKTNNQSKKELHSKLSHSLLSIKSDNESIKGDGSTGDKRIPMLKAMYEHNQSKAFKNQNSFSSNNSEMGESAIFQDCVTSNHFMDAPLKELCTKGDLRLQKLKCLASSSTLKLNESFQSETEPADVSVAKDVIVANISESYGIHYILHLFEKHNPIAISTMKTILYPGIRYCHVYFTSWEDALATQLEFDNYLLEGNGLIVILAQQLLSQAQSK